MLYPDFVSNNGWINKLKLHALEFCIFSLDNQFKMVSNNHRFLHHVSIIWCSWLSKTNTQGGLQEQLNRWVLWKGVPNKFCKIERKASMPELLSNKIPRLQPATLLKNRLRHRFFPKNFEKLFRILFSRTPLGDCLQA